MVLSGDHVYKMDYSKMLRFHIDRNADATLATLEVPVADGRRFGIVGVDEDDRVREFQEKPAHAAVHPRLRPISALASMGIYIFKADVLVKALEDDAANVDSQHDFGKNILPSLIAPKAVYSYRFYDENKKSAKYWRDIGTLDAYYDASMDLCQISPEFNLYDPEWPLRTYQPQAPPAKFVFAEEGVRCGQALDSIVSNGCIISGSRIVGSILCPNVRVHSFCDISTHHPHARRARGPPRADPPGHHRSRRAHPARRAHRLRPRRGPPAPRRDGDGVVVVTANDDPLIRPVSDEALRLEAEADRSGPERVHDDIHLRSGIALGADARSRAFTAARFSTRGETPRWKWTSGPAARLAAPPCPRAPPPANARRWSCATATRARYLGKGVRKAVATSTARSRRP